MFGSYCIDLILQYLARFIKSENGKYLFKDASKFRAYQEKEKELMDTEEDIELYKIPRDVFDKEAEKLITNDGVSMGDCDILERYIVED